jgi:MFS family permease
MYTSVRTTSSTPTAPILRRPARVSINVLLLGLTSLFTDLSQEMVTAVLPIYLTFELRLTPLQFGLVDGLYHGASALARFVGGLIADRRARYKEVAATGYALSAATKAGLILASGAWLPVTGMLFVDRVGKGIRTAPRDALISLSAEPEDLGRSFGVHRALDTVGALLGPIAAFVLLVVAPLAFDAIFVVSLAAGLIGLGILVLFVRNRATPAEDRRAVSARRALGLLRGRSFRRVVMVGALLGFLTVSDGFLYLMLQRTAAIDLRWFPLLFVGTAVVYLALAIPLGRLADRVGRPKVLVGGYAALLGAYLILLAGAPTGWLVLGCLALHGTFYAATDGVLMAISSSVVEPSLRTSGLGLVTTAVSLSRFGASVAFGGLWLALGPRWPIVVFGLGLAAAVPIAWRSLRVVPS